MSLNSALKREDGRIEVRFDFDRKVVDAIRQIPGRVWINDRKVWTLPGNDKTITALRSLFGKSVDRYLGCMEKVALPRIEEAEKLKVPEVDFFVSHPKMERKLPNVLSKIEVNEILSAVTNTKHRLMLTLIYSAGLSVSEVAGMQLADIDAARKSIVIRQGRGHKDRSVLLPERTLELIGEYRRIYRPEKWLFPGEEEGHPISIRTIQAVFNEACRKAGIQQKATVHCLRRALATHLLESGVDLRSIQKLRGCANSKPTEIDVRVSRGILSEIENPLDDIIG